MLVGIEQIQNGIDALAEIDPTECTGEELAEAVVALEQAKARLCAHKARVLDAFSLSGQWSLDGSRSAAAWVAREMNTRIDDTRADVKLAKRLRAMPTTRAAFEAGAISERHADRLSKLAFSKRSCVRNRFAEWEDTLVDKARTMDWPRLHQYLTYWTNAADPDGAEDKARDDHEARHVHLSPTLGDTWRLDGQLDPLGGTELATALERIYQELYETDWTEARARLGDKATIDDLARTPGQRRADALVEMARRAMAAPVGARLPEPLITVLVGYETLNGPILQLLNVGTVATPGQVAELLSHADIERIVYGPDGRTITDVGRRGRFYRGGLRRTIEVRDRHCTYPGCTEPPDRCQVDHVVPWAQGGATTQRNGRLRCGPHNRKRGPEDQAGNPIDTRLPLDTRGLTDPRLPLDTDNDDAWDMSVLDDDGAWVGSLATGTADTTGTAAGSAVGTATVASGTATVDTATGTVDTATGDLATGTAPADTATGTAETAPGHAAASR